MARASTSRSSRARPGTSAARTARAKRASSPAPAAAPAAPLEPPEPQLATLVTEAPAGDDWLHEQKFDGYRILALRDGDDVSLLSRRFNDWSEQLAPVAAALASLPVRRLILDGEVVVFAPDGRTSFQALQNALGAGGADLVYVAFDVLVLGDRYLRARPLAQRKAELAAFVAALPAKVGARLRYSDHVIGKGDAFFAQACAAGLEGIISKRRDRPYRPGRGPDWLKVKCLQRQELVIGGFTDPRGSRTGIGALLLGYHQDGALRYAGKVGTGFSGRTLDALYAALSPLERARSPFSPAPQRAWTGAGVHWVEPTLVAEVAFGEWTDDGRLRHPVFKGLRRDKAPSTIVREQAATPRQVGARAARSR
jgi:bifunctional non-homologous end joining protein LigD